ERACGLDQLVVVDAAPRQPLAFGGLAVEDVAEDDGGGRALRTEKATHHPGVAAAGVEAELEEAGVEPRRSPGDAHVAGQRQVYTRPDGGAVDGRDRRHRRSLDPKEAFVHRAQPAPFRSPAGLAEVGEVGTRAEG